ncbi:hypothetical protein Prudu_009493, partial [Prunus dulcis]
RPSRHHTATRSPAPVPLEPQLASRHFPTDPSPVHAGSWPEPAIFADGGVRTFSSNISLNSSPNLSSEAPGARQNWKRDFRGVEAVDVRGIHHRATHNLSASSQLVWIS